MAPKLKVHHLFLMKTEKSDKGRIIGHTKMGDARFFFAREDGTLLDDGGVRAMIGKLKEHLPPDWSIEVVEKEVGVTADPHFEATCPEHGVLMDQFFCGKCGKLLKPILVP